MTDPIWSLPTDELDAELASQPSMVTWSRLEPLALSSDLTPGLQTLVGDPLWMIGRQWQFGELRGEDAGTPISTVIEVQHGPISRLRRGTSGDAIALVDERAPLEALVEAEAVPRPALRIRAESGLQLLRRLAAAGFGSLRDRVVERWAVEAADGAALYAGRVPDAARLVVDLEPLAAGPGEPLRALPAGLTVAGGADAEATVRAVFGDWLAWYRGYLVQGDGSAWLPSRQEYTFALQAELPGGPVMFDAAEYTTGRLDWPDFDAKAGDLGPTPPSRSGTTSRQVRLPAPATFPGMAADRLWQFEDARVYLGGIEAGPTDLARMALVEFSLAYGVDWFTFPIDVPAGAAIWVHSLEVIDTFGVSVMVNPARQPGGWTMFQLARPDEQTFVSDVWIVPPVVAHLLQSEPLEEVALFRDEMANLVWAVERIVAGPSGEPVKRDRETPKESVRQQIPGDLGDAAIVYRLMTPVPDHWVPFVAVPARQGGGVELERRPLLHFRDDGTTEVTHPRGVLLNEGGQRLRLAEEEVPRDGVVVTRRYQLARTPDGGTALWIGRAKRVGEGEGWSGLRFDTALPAR